MIEKLTAEQEAQKPEYVEKWRKIGLSTEPNDIDLSVELISEIYAEKGYKPPEFLIADSPLHAAHIIKRLWKDESEPKSLSDCIEEVIQNSNYGSHDAAWLSFYDFMDEVLGLTDMVLTLKPHIELSKVCGWWITYDTHCIMVQRHSAIHTDDEDRLHCEDGPAIAYPDGWGVYFHRNFRIPDNMSWIVTDPERITFETINNQDNVEIRRIMLEKLGALQYFKQGDGVMIDEDTVNQIQLWEMDVRGEIKQLTLCNCHSRPENWYAEYLNDNIRFKSVKEAHGWQMGLEPGEEFEIIVQT